MKTQIPIEEYLKIVLDFNKKYPGSHVGGSIGLLLHGIDLKRQFVNTDLDITLKTELPEKGFDIENSEESSNPEDFDIQLRVYQGKDSALYIKVDINVRKESQFDVIGYGGQFYCVSKMEDILAWKKKYADKGVQKHIDDLITIETGVRPPEQVFETTDDLPF